jgi:TfoX/Sxy family transcriptional regulator of competence genes
MAKAAKKEINKEYEEKVALYNKLIESKPEIDRKGDTMPYTSLNGNMFTILSKEGVLGLRMAKEDIEAFNKKYNAKPLIMYGAHMKEYVAVPDELFKKTKELKKYLDQSYEYAKTLKVKPTKKAVKKK